MIGWNTRMHHCHQVPEADSPFRRVHFILTFLGRCWGKHRGGQNTTGGRLFIWLVGREGGRHRGWNSPWGVDLSEYFIQLKLTSGSFQNYQYSAGWSQGHKPWAFRGILHIEPVMCLEIEAFEGSLRWPLPKLLLGWERCPSNKRCFAKSSGITGEFKPHSSLLVCMKCMKNSTLLKKKKVVRVSGILKGLWEKY